MAIGLMFTIPELTALVGTRVTCTFLSSVLLLHPLRAFFSVILCSSSSVLCKVLRSGVRILRDVFKCVYFRVRVMYDFGEILLFRFRLYSLHFSQSLCQYSRSPPPHANTGDYVRSGTWQDDSRNKFLM